MIVYTLTRLAGLLDFPVNFSVDEAASSILAADFVNNRFFDPSGHLLPFHFLFLDKSWYGLTVYLQAAGFTLFGHSLWVTRSLAVLTTTLLAFWLARIMRDGFDCPCWWSVPMLLAAMPGWFPLSRTALTTPLAITLYTGMLDAYLQYRRGNDRLLYLSVLLGALAAWVSSAGLAMIIASIPLLLLVNIRYHRQHRSTTLKALGLGGLFVLPALRTVLIPPAFSLRTLALGDSYWGDAISFPAKLTWMLAHFKTLANPLIWFSPVGPWKAGYEKMPGYEWIHWSLLPFIGIGLWQVVRKWRLPASQLVFLALFASGVSAVMSRNLFPTGLMLLAPLTVLAGLGIAALLRRLDRFSRISGALPVYLLALLLSAGSLMMLSDALSNAPRWLADSGKSPVPLRQVFNLATNFVTRHPGQPVQMTPTLDNQIDQLTRFYAPGVPNLLTGNIQYFIKNRIPDLEKTGFLITPQEYRQVVESRRFSKAEILQTIESPPGQAALYLVMLAYQSDFDAWMKNMQDSEPSLAMSSIQLNGEAVQVAYSKLDMGQLQNIFDGNEQTLIRTASANPLVIWLDFQKPRALSGVALRLGAEPVRLTVHLDPADGRAPETYTKTGEAAPHYKWVSLRFKEIRQVKRLRLEVLDFEAGPVSNVHLWELQMLP